MLKTRKLIAVGLVAGLAMLAGAFPAARAQTPSLPPPPYNVDLGSLITNALRTAGTVTSAVQQNLANRGVVCGMIQSAVSGSPSTTFSIQGYDAANLSWQTLATSSTFTTSTTNYYSIWLQPGLVAADVPSNGVGKSLHLPRAWRVSQTIAGTSGPAISGKIDCNTLN